MRFRVLVERPVLVVGDSFRQHLQQFSSSIENAQATAAGYVQNEPPTSTITIFETVERVVDTFHGTAK